MLVFFPCSGCLKWVNSFSLVVYALIYQLGLSSSISMSTVNWLLWATRASLTPIILHHFHFALHCSFFSDLCLTHLHLLPFSVPGKIINRLLILERKMFFFSLIYFNVITFYNPSSPLVLSPLWCKPSDSQGTLQPVLARYTTRWKVCSQCSPSKMPPAHPCSPWALSCPCQADEERGQGKERM